VKRIVVGSLVAGLIPGRGMRSGGGLLNRGGRREEVGESPMSDLYRGRRSDDRHSCTIYAIA
jgi:hypothetical protein